MKVTAICYGAMRDYAGDREVSVDLPEGATVADLMDALGAPRNLASAILIDERPGDITGRLGGGMRVTLMPPFSGGEEEEPRYG